MYYLSNAIFFGSMLCMAGALTCQAADSGAGPPGISFSTAPAGYGAAQIRADGRPILLETGKGTLLRLKGSASTVFVANPAVADVQVKSPKLIYITAKAPGETVIYAVDAHDKVLLNAPVRVTPDLTQLRQAMAELVPGQPVTVGSVAGDLVLSGLVASAGDAAKLRALAASAAAESKGAKIIDHLQIATPNQVNLRVRIAEVSRSVLKEFGINWTGVTTGLGQNLAFKTNLPTTTQAIVPNSLIFTGIGGQAVNAELDALATEGFVTDLAEPNLTAMSGQTASFLAGGEFPVPVAGTASTTGIPTITVEFKQFGVSLAFTPTVIDATHLNLRVRPEVSELSTQGEVSVPLSPSATVTIPALTVRRADTTVELGSGESFALAGLLQNTSQQTVTKVPGLGDLPVLGALFRSNQFQHNESELVVIVTPYLVQPVATRLADPLDGFQLPHDAQRVLDSSTYRQELPAPTRGPLGAGGTGLIGPAGFQLD
ncbi:MAG TPA: type II and III secretion system protein family protein [Stellaceae bacterium]|nr:type II and III secretion system protein family protein [Stellaceae bacterium]